MLDFSKATAPSDAGIRNVSLNFRDTYRMTAVVSASYGYDGGLGHIHVNFYRSKSGATVKCIVWINNQYVGVGTAKGFGYAKEGRAFLDCMQRNGASGFEAVNGDGYNGVENAVKRIAELKAGNESGFWVECRTIYA